MTELEKAREDLADIESQIEGIKMRLRRINGSRYEARRSRLILEDILADLFIQARNIKSYIETFEIAKG